MQWSSVYKDGNAMEQHSYFLYSQEDGLTSETAPSKRMSRME